MMLISLFFFVKFLLFLLIIVLWGETATAQLFYYEGKVIDKNGWGISDVTIEIDGKKWSKTNMDGDFTFAHPKRNCRVRLKHIGYNELELNWHVGERIGNIVLQARESTIEGVDVYGQAIGLSPTLHQLEEKHKNIAGGTSVVEMKPNSQRLETIKDALRYEPGVVIQDFFGANDQPRISIRGSGIQSNPQRRGVYFLQDGIPTNFADGSFIIGVMDPAIASSIEVFKGANALQYGAATLGGAVNFNSRTGRNEPGMHVKVEGGTFGYGQFNLLAGREWGMKDGFISISGSRQDGFRLQNSNEKINIAANFGYRISRRVDHRTYLNYTRIHFEIPGPLTLEMIGDDPKQVNPGVNLPYSMGPNIRRDQPRREASVFRLADKLSIFINSSSDLTVSAYYQYIQDRFAFPIVLSTQRSEGHDVGLSAQYTYRFNKQVFSSGLLANYGVIDRKGHINKDGLDSYAFSHDKLHAPNFTLYAQHQYRFSDSWRLITNVQAVYNERNSKDVFPDPELRPWYSHSSHKYRYFFSENISLNQRYFALNPHVGAIFNTGKNRDIQLFANVSGSYEPPTFDELVGTAVSENINTSPKKLFAVRLDKQSAYTIEVGTRRNHTRYAWNISLYQSWLKNELLEVKDFVLGVKETKNYPHTVHRGLEFSGMWKPVVGLFSKESNDFLSLNGMYTHSDFYFSRGAYQGNKLAGVPPHYITGSLEYRYPKRFFLAANIESQPVKSFVDHTNTLSQPSYTIYGARMGTDVLHNWSFYIEAKNILDKRYAASYIIQDQIHAPALPFPDFGVDNIAFFMPGQTRSFYIGLTYKLHAKKANAYN